MAGSTAALAWQAPRTAATPRLAEIAFAALLLLIYVGTTPFALRAATVPVGAPVAQSGAGDALRQVCFLSVFVLVLWSALKDRGLRALASVPPLMAMLLAWCVASALWSAEPAVTARRAVLAAVVVYSAMMSVETLGVRQSLRILKWVLGGVLVVNWLSIPLIPQAVHLPSDPEPLLAGDWRGLFFHKNIAGAVSAITAMLFFFAALETRRLADIALCALAVGFTVMTRSKTSMVLLPLALAAGLTYRAAWRSGLDRLILAVAAVTLAACVVGVAVMDQSLVDRIFANPEGFTGRTEIWRAEIAYIADHPLLGAGFGSFADTGALSPLHDYVPQKWVNNVAEGHDAYLEIAVTMGLVGALAALAALIAAPFVSFWKMPDAAVAPSALLFAVFVFMAFHNFVESDFLDGNGPAWTSYLVVLGVLRLVRRETQTGAVS